MFKITCNIDKKDRMNRVVFGIILFLGALAGFGKIFMLVLAAILVIEGIVGWCGIPYLVSRLRNIF